jgi:hypothetical protein
VRTSPTLHGPGFNKSPLISVEKDDHAVNLWFNRQPCIVKVAISRAINFDQGESERLFSERQRPLQSAALEVKCPVRCTNPNVSSRLMFSGDEVWSSTAFQTVPKRTCDSKARRFSACRSIAVCIFTTRVLPMARSIPPFLKSIAPIVSKLRVAWSYPTGDRNKYLFNPIVVDRRMYVLARNNAIVAPGCEIRCRTGSIPPKRGRR